MAKIQNKSKKSDNEAISENDETSHLTSLEETILRMRFGLGKDASTDSLERNLSDDLRKKLQFLELKAFEQSGRINELLSDIKGKGSKNKQ